MGSNHEGRLGIGETKMPHTSQPCLVETLSAHHAVDISCGWGHTVAITKDGAAFSWGVGEFGALGSGFTRNEWTPVRVKLQARAL